ncbi:MAG: hypothetical protein RIE32_11815 [Phycisphaerales bacterium]
MPETAGQPKPPRRRPFRRALAWVLRLSLCVVILGFMLGRAFTDGHLWSQWLFWAPHEAWLLALVSLAVAILVVEPPEARRRGAWLGPALTIVLAVSYVSLAHWRLHNALLREPGETVLRVYHWNATEATDSSLQAFLRDADPFGLSHDGPAVVVLANPPLRLDWPEIVRMLADEEIARASITSHVRRGGRFVIISGPPMTRAGWTSLGLEAKTTDPDLIDNGTAMFATIDLGPDPVTVWAIDWPSDPQRSRLVYAAQTLERIDASSHLVFRPTTAGPLEQHKEIGFPPPDVVVGDFNTARGSASVAELLPGMASAHAQAGIGPDYGWPRFIRDGRRDRRVIPFLGLDQAYVAPDRWRATAYRMLDLGQGTHRAQEIFLTGADGHRAAADPPAARAEEN